MFAIDREGITAGAKRPVLPPADCSEFPPKAHVYPIRTSHGSHLGKPGDVGMRRTTLIHTRCYGERGNGPGWCTPPGVIQAWCVALMPPCCQWVLVV